MVIRRMAVTIIVMKEFVSGEVDIRQPSKQRVEEVSYGHCECQTQVNVVRSRTIGVVKVDVRPNIVGSYQEGADNDNERRRGTHGAH